MTDEEIRAMLAVIDAPVDIPMPIPPNMTAIPAAAVLAAGGEPAEVEKWVKAQLGWAKRLPPQFLAPDAKASDALFFLVPERALAGSQQAAPDGEAPTADGAGLGLAGAELIAFAPTTDLKRARAFYEGTLGLAVDGESPIAVAFRIGGTLLRVVKVEQYAAPPFTILGWSVPDIAATARELAGRGVAFIRYPGLDQDRDAVWDAPGGARVAWFKDPDGSTLSLTQF